MFVCVWLLIIVFSSPLYVVVCWYSAQCVWVSVGMDLDIEWQWWHKIDYHSEWHNWERVILCVNCIVTIHLTQTVKIYIVIETLCTIVYRMSEYNSFIIILIVLSAGREHYIFKLLICHKTQETWPKIYVFPIYEVKPCLVSQHYAGSDLEKSAYVRSWLIWKENLINLEKILINLEKS